MFEATNAEFPTHSENLGITLQVMVERNIPSTNMERGVVDMKLTPITLNYTRRSHITYINLFSNTMETWFPP